MSSAAPDDLLLLVQGLASGNNGGIYDEVEDVRALLDGLGDAIQGTNKIPTKPTASLHRNPEFSSVRNLRQRSYSFSTKFLIEMSILCSGHDVKNDNDNAKNDTDLSKLATLTDIDNYTK